MINDIIKTIKELPELGYSGPVDEGTIYKTEKDLGLVIWQDSSGVIYQSIPNSNTVKIFDNLADFIKEQI